MSCLNYYSDTEEGEIYSVKYEDCSGDDVYRSIQVESRTEVTTYAPGSDTYGDSKSVTVLNTERKMVVEVAHSSSACPPVPYGISQNNFEISSAAVESIRQSLIDFLTSQTNFDFSSADPFMVSSLRKIFLFDAMHF
jgi:hypothetical protein